MLHANPFLRLFISICLLVSLSSCAAVSKDGREILYGESGVNCSTAGESINLLRAERPTGGERGLSILRSFAPPAAIIGIITGTYYDAWRTLTGKYHDDIDYKIYEIQSTCGV